MLLDNVRNTIAKHKLLELGDKVLCAVSGGADSLCMLHVMLNLRAEYDLEIYALNVNHLIRGKESDEDSDYVKRVCEAANIKCFYREYDVLKLAKELKMGTEECGRKLRYEFFSEIANELGGAKIATAHNLNDNAETVLFRLIRGSSLEGLSGISYKRDNIIRPLLDVERSEIEKYLHENNIKWRTDSSNLSDEYSRNKIRLNVFPQLREIFPDAERKIVNAAMFMREDNDYLNECAQNFEEEFGSEDFFFADKFNLLPDSIKRRVAKIYLGKWGVKEISLDKINAIINLAQNESGKEFNLTKNSFAVKCYNKIILRQEEDKMEFCVKINIGETFESKNWIIKVSLYDYQVKKHSNNMAIFDGEKLKGPLNVRYWSKGDKMKVQGLGGSKKLSDIFSDAKIDSVLRDSIPLVECEGEILYLCGIRQSASYFTNDFTNKYVVIEYFTKE